ncbi:MAG TPA: RNA polymerase sigma factor [Gammaproteobacteria bacterium]|nr:RNA polymerase sigma factor [Gammaproteobacteria bacterium]
MSIIKLFKSRHRPADSFERLVSPHINTLYRVAFRLCHNADDAEELVQLLLTRLFSKLDKLEQVESLSPWLVRSIYNLYVDTYRKQQRTLAVISPDLMPENVVSNDRTPYEDMELSQNQAIIVKAMQQLNEQQRLVILLHDAEGYTLTELADMLQTPIGTLKSRLHRGRAHIRELTEMELIGDQERDIDIEGMN